MLSGTWRRPTAQRQLTTSSQLAHWDASWRLRTGLACERSAKCFLLKIRAWRTASLF